MESSIRDGIGLGQGMEGPGGSNQKWWGLRGSDQRIHQKRDFADTAGFAGIRINVKMREAVGDSEVCD